MRGKRSNMVIRRVTGSKTVDVYKFEKGKVEKLDTITIDSSKVNEKELANKYNVTKVMTDVVKTETKYYGVPIEKFMELAIEIKKEVGENAEDSAPKVTK